MTDEAQTEAIPRVPTAVDRAPESGGAQPDTEEAEAPNDWAQEMYEAALAKLNALHDRWTAAIADIHEPETTGELETAVA